MRLSNVKFIILFVFLGCVVLTSARTVPRQPWFPQAPPLPDPPANATRVSTPDELMHALANVQEGETILLEDGFYAIPRYLEIRTDHVTLRSASGNRDAVVLDGSQGQLGELLGFRQCRGVTVADLTIQNVRWNGFKINSDDNVQELTIYHCVIHNVWQRGVKSVRVPENRREQIRPRNCKVQYCLFYNDHPKRFSDDSRDTPETFNGNYIGGIDTMYAKDWTISDNVFIGIQGRTREGRGCVFMWHHAENCVIERNIIIDCDVGVALGNSSGIGPGQSSVHGTNMIVRNNFITRTPETGILADFTKDCKIVNNTVFDPGNRMKRLIRIVHDNPGLLVANNLLSGPGMSVETNDPVRFQKNLISDYTNVFVDPLHGNLHLRFSHESIVNQGIPLPFVSSDIDMQRREQPPEIGADEWNIQSHVKTHEAP